MGAASEFMQKAHGHLRSGRYAEVAAASTAALEHRPSEPQLHHLLGDALARCIAESEQQYIALVVGAEQRCLVAP